MLHRPRNRRRTFTAIAASALALSWIGALVFADWWSDRRHSSPVADAPAVLAGPKIAQPTAEPPDELPVVNLVCPINPDRHVGRGRFAVPSCVRMWRDRRVGFCCEECPATWDTMTDQERDEALNEAFARNPTPVDPVAGG